MRNKQVEFNPYIYTFFKSCFGYEISVFNTQQGGIQNSRFSREMNLYKRPAFFQIPCQSLYSHIMYPTHDYECLN